MDNQSAASQGPAAGSSTSAREQIDDSEHIIASKKLERHHHAHPLAEEKQSDPLDKMKAHLKKLISDLDSTQVSRQNKEEAQGILANAIEKASDKVKTRDDSSCSSDSGRSTPIELNTNEAESMHHLKEVRYKSKRVDSGGEVLDEDSDEDHVTAIRESHHNDQKYGFTWREKEDRHHNITSIEANIHCPALRKVLTTNLAHVPFIHWSQLQLIFRDPFPDIVTNWHQLRRAAEIQQAAGGCGTHLRKLLDHIAETSQVKRYLSQEKNTDQNRIVRFRDLSLYFRPGEMLFANVGDQPRAFLLFRGLMSWRQSESTNSNHPLSFDLFAWKYDFDGISFSRDPFLVRIRSFNNPRNITALPCYPLRYHPNHDAIRQKLIQRGNQYLYACTQEKEKKMFHYTGVLHYKSKLPAEIFDSQYAMPITEGAVLGVVLGGKLRENEAEGASPPTDEANLDEENEEESHARMIHYSGSVIVDPGLYRRYGPLLMPKFRATSIPELWKHCECVECQSNEAMREVLKNNYDNVSKTESGWQKFGDEQRLICPDKVEGFALGNKKWVYLDVSSECLHEVQNKDRRVGGPQPAGSSDSAFNKIILPKDKSWDETKEMIEELVRTHGKDLKRDSSVPNPFEDVIEGKGQGLVVLLYGSSGVGKTLMAESVAKFVGRPLLRVSMSDIGLNISNVEKTLEKLFNMAVRWGAVLLFDEADIFLARRTSGGGEDLTRNAIVGVFLNVLDYYSGILFLTTNRLIPFDTAVLPRIHLAIEFPPFDKAARKALAIQFLSQIETTAIEPAVYDWVESVSGSNLNGRQIRNVISAATTLARAHERPLKIADLQKFWDRAEHFQQQMQNEIFLAEQAMLPNASMRSRY